MISTIVLGDAAHYILSDTSQIKVSNTVLLHSDDVTLPYGKVDLSHPKVDFCDVFGELPCHHQELVDLRVFQLIVGVPKLSFHLLLNPVVGFS